MNRRQRISVRKTAEKSIIVTFWVAIAGILIFGWILLPTASERASLAILSTAGGLFVFAYYRWMLPAFGAQRWMNYLGMLGPIVLIAMSAYWLAPYRVNIALLYVGVIVGIGILAGRRYAFEATLLSAVAVLVVVWLQNRGDPNFLARSGLYILVLLVTGYLVSQLAGDVYDQIHITNRQNRNLTLLLRAGDLLSDGAKMPDNLQQIALLVYRYLPVKTCRIYLLRDNGTELETYRVYPKEELITENPLAGQSAPASHPLPALFQDTLANHHHCLVSRAAEPRAVRELEAANLLNGETSVVGIFPMQAQGKDIGLITVGFQESLSGELRDREIAALLQNLATQIATAIHNYTLRQAAQLQAERLEVLNEVAKAIGSTIEFPALLELIYEQLSRVIPTETYFIGLLDESEMGLDLRILIDDGERFPPAKISLGNGLASWVLTNRQPLLVNHLSAELDQLPVKPVILGQEKMSESWLGVPVIVGEEMLGLLAVASYTPRAFDQDDITLLSNVAAQAALALDNARRHAQVVEQARRDSLTGAYNHGYLLERLDAVVRESARNGQPVSLIMLDIDLFKEYNDQYGHQVGDEVLRIVVEAIQQHVKQRDIVGRWGGEEFAVGLPGANLEQALQVARRIRRTLAGMHLSDQHGHPLPKPTVSQGVASFPDHALDSVLLVDIADRALYLAKESGRDQVRQAAEVGAY